MRRSTTWSPTLINSVISAHARSDKTDERERNMFEKQKLKGTIKKLKQEINDIEAKRSRSQAALVQAILEQKDPSDEDVEFFNRYTAEIEQVRDQLKQAQDKLAGL